ncbi:melatonin receptor type 1A-A-like [Gigantopelta aegis]|uniref:melatonin receptor type 1A-A-like n=1 Tax=Gigantopelta aegis TaxID=1735272 RepID=UPI001B88D2D0|nr:melatonin receptor type 1A-A-like [Gigantopelta aegis]
MMSNSSQIVDDRTPVELGFETGSLVLVSVLGVPGNLLVLSAIFLYKKIRTVANGFVFNLAIADLLVCTVVVPMLIPSRIHRKWLFGDDLCVIQGFFNMVTMYSSLFFLSAIAINRLTMIRFPKYYHTIFTPTSSFVIYLALWGLAVLSALAPMIGWGRYKFDTTRDNCLFDRKAAPSYSIFMAIIGISIPILVCAASYMWIWAIFVSNRTILRQLSNDQNIGGTNFSREEVKLTKNLFIIWVAFFVCWAPMTIMLLTDPKGLIARPYYVASVWFLLANSCINPFIYGLTNKHFREGYKNIFVLCKRKLEGNVVHPSPDQQEVMPGHCGQSANTSDLGRQPINEQPDVQPSDVTDMVTASSPCTLQGSIDQRVKSRKLN